EVGGAVLGVGLGLLALGLSRETSLGGALVRGLLGAAAASARAVFVWHERRATVPLIEPRLFAHRAFAAGNVLSLLSGVALIVAMVDVPLYAATVLQRTPVEGGLLLMRLVVRIRVGAAAGGWGARRLGAATAGAAGTAARGVGRA